MQLKALSCQFDSVLIVCIAGGPKKRDRGNRLDRRGTDREGRGSVIPFGSSRLPSSGMADSPLLSAGPHPR